MIPIFIVAVAGMCYAAFVTTASCILRSRETFEDVTMGNCNCGGCTFLRTVHPVDSIDEYIPEVSTEDDTDSSDGGDWEFLLFKEQTDYGTLLRRREHSPSPSEVTEAALRMEPLPKVSGQ